jgi:hypothetical protein
MNYYVEIPNTALEMIRFPETCPFTLEPSPKTNWEVRGRTKSNALLIPAVPVMLVNGRKCVFRLPASSKFVRRQHALTLLCFGSFLLFVMAVLTSELAGLPSKIAEPTILVALSVGTIAYGLGRLFQRHVWIDYVGQDFVEIVFKRKKYADEFCEINNLKHLRKLVNFRTS